LPELLTRASQSLFSDPQEESAWIGESCRIDHCASQQLIAARLSQGEFYDSPQVTIIQKEYATQGISVAGEVQKPGIYPLLGSHTLLQAISAAGGTTVNAGNDVTIIHIESPNQPQHADLSSLRRQIYPE
jgi:polysaccharide biosynthesis/export protein